jgi:hypothetical protein
VKAKKNSASMHGMSPLFIIFMLHRAQ